MGITLLPIQHMNSIRHRVSIYFPVGAINLNEKGTNTFFYFLTTLIQLFWHWRNSWY